MSAKKSGPRVRKAPTVKVSTETKVSVESKKNRFTSKIWLPFKLVFRPIKKVLSLLVPRYFVNSWKEVRQVAWPSRRDTWRLTLAVFLFAAIFGSLVAGVDKIIDIIFKKLVLS